MSEFKSFIMSVFSAMVLVIFWRIARETFGLEVSILGLFFIFYTILMEKLNQINSSIKKVLTELEKRA